jgi:photosystem I P700 chlorophyll a apoprotein A2
MQVDSSGTLNYPSQRCWSQISRSISTTDLTHHHVAVGPFGVCSADLLVHHAFALGVHTAALILPRDAFDASGSHLLADKRQYGFGFACDEPGRGGTCDSSA